MLKASHIWTKRAAFSLALMSSTPASDCGWLAMMPVTWPSIRARTQSTLVAQRSWISRNSPWSTISSITLRMSYGRLPSAGTRSSRESLRRSTGSSLTVAGGISRLFCGSSDRR